jgi:diguanylate cyclase (GGDEF)-like protein/PAS domain S-box-containing protein
MSNKAVDNATQLLQQSSQPALLVEMHSHDLLFSNPPCHALLKQDQEQIKNSETYLRIIKKAQQLACKELLFFNYEIFDGDNVLLITAEVKDSLILIYLQKKFIFNMPSNQLITILDSLGAQVYCKDANYRYTYANKKVGDLVNKDPKSLIGKTDFDLFDEAAVNKIQREIDSITSGKTVKIASEETLFIKSLGKAKTFLSVKKPLTGKNEKLVGMFGISTDISHYKATENKLNTILDNVPVYIYIKDLEQRFIYANKMVQELFNCSEEGIIGRTASDLMGYEESKEYDPLDFKLLKTQSTVEGIEKLQSGDKTFHYWSVKAPLFDDDGTLTSLIGMSTDITRSVELEQGFEETNKELKKKIKEITKLQESLWEQATQDPLTQLFNRRYFNDHSNKEIQKAERSKKPLVLLLLDADYFKDINDQFGHDIGDQVLIKLSKIMIGECRRTDIVCRYGGEEFVILMPEANEKIALNRAEKIRLRYQKEVSEFLKTPSTISIGIAMWDKSLETLEEFTKIADKAMYQAKENGRNQVVIYNSNPK